jgi:DNA-directed RNA polymerase specialized sigma24 family protein
MKKITPADSTLVRRVKKNGCNESYKLLRSRHEKLFYKICQRYIPVAYAKGIKKEDILSDKDFVIFKAISSYKPNRKTKFSTWLGNCTKYHCLGLINTNNRLVTSEQDMLEVVMDSQAKQIFDQKSKNQYDKEYVFNILNNLKDKRIARVFELRYYENYEEKTKPTWSFISKKIKTSTQTAINLHHRGKEMLFKKLKAENRQDIV